MRVLRLAPAAVVPLLLVVTACSGSQATGTEIEPSFQAQAPTYEVVSEEPTADGEQITVSVGDAPTQLAVDDLVGDLQEERDADGVYELTVVCAADDAELATATWAQGAEAFETTGLAEGEIDSAVDADAVCEG